MASKFQFITELYSRTLTKLTGDYESWTGFLRAACYNYKCPFDEQVLIYAQRPNATAVLELEKWNRQFGRWVNAGAAGIAVIAESRHPRYSDFSTRSHLVNDTGLCRSGHGNAGGHLWYTVRKG